MKCSFCGGKISWRDMYLHISNKGRCGMACPNCSNNSENKENNIIIIDEKPISNLSRTNPKSVSKEEINELKRKNTQKLIMLNKYPISLTHTERFIRSTLDRLKICNIPQYVIEGLKGDSKSYRIADFFLPEHNIIVEHCGRWDKSEQEKKQYRHKRIVYTNNKLKFIFIYPKSLNNLTYYIKQRMKEIGAQ